MVSFSRTVRVVVLAVAAVAWMAGFVGGGKAGKAAAQGSDSDADYVGTWHLMFQGKAFATLTIERHGEQFSGSVTGVSIEMGDDGKLTKAVAIDGPTSTLHVSLENGVLHLSEKDGEDEIAWTMTLTSPKTGELRFTKGAPPNAEAVRMEKLWSEPPVEK